MTPAPAARAAGFVHETVTYQGDDGFLAGVLPFVREGLERDEVVVVAEPRPRIGQLRDALGDDAAAVTFHDMAEIGANPARIIGVWAQTLERTIAAGRRLRGVGEPAYPGRSAAEYAECEVHELLLNTAFEGGPGWRLLCPYDQGGLPPPVTDGAGSTHPYRAGPHGPEATGSVPTERVGAALAAPLPAPRGPVLRGGYGADDVPAVRRTVASFARSCSLPQETVEDLELAAGEVATNSVRHGGGRGLLAMWLEPDAAVVEFTDAGRVRDPLTGRLLPPLRSEGGRGLYLVNHLCDLVQLRTSSAGTTVRLITWR